MAFAGVERGAGRGVGREVTRLAPSPTGALHLGNARTFLVNWAMARQGGWTVLLRVEDLDTPRVKAGAAAACVETLRWLGLDWDEGPIVQSDDLGPHREAMERLARAGAAYPCELTRGEIAAAASAPNEGDEGGDGAGGEVAFPVSLRPAVVPRVFDDAATNWRFVVADGAVVFEDGFAGAQRCEPGRTVGDFVVWTKRGQPSYQLAVVVDDHRQGVTRVVRGDDLLDSAGRQLLLYRALGYGDVPGYTHLPLVRGADGRRLAKRHGDTRLAAYRARGVAAERVIGLCGYWCGVSPERRAMDAGAFLAGFDLGRMPRSDVVFTAEDETWLVS